jgi:hypothetical protein
VVELLLRPCRHEAAAGEGDRPRDGEGISETV